jgi:hypothetical protein
MSSKIKINTKEILSDIRARVSDFELMSKYRLSSGQLDRLLERLAKSGMLRREELEERGAFFDDPANRSQTRRLARTYLWRPLVIEDLKDVLNRGLVTDLSAMGFRTRGIRADIGDEKTFAVYSTEFKGERSINLSAACRWFKEEGEDSKLWVAGFQIIHVSDDDLKLIRRILAYYSRSG